MDIQSLKLVYFSPTGTSKKIIQNIARGIDITITEEYDITKPEARTQAIQTKENELLLIAVPVYMGRVPALINDYLCNIKASNTPVVCIVVYGNRTFDNALLELKDISVKSGCIPVAGAAFIGEHSFSSSERPVAMNRPNTEDLETAELFGKRIKEKLQNTPRTEEIKDFEIPGNYPYGGITELWSVDFIEINDSCNNSGICAKVCPTGAIDINNTKNINIVKCISCCACIKSCPENARIMKDSDVKKASIRLHNLYKTPKDPVIFY